MNFTQQYVMEKVISYRRWRNGRFCYQNPQIKLGQENTCDLTNPKQTNISLFKAIKP